MRLLFVFFLVSCLKQNIYVNSTIDDFIDFFGDFRYPVYRYQLVELIKAASEYEPSVTLTPDMEENVYTLMSTYKNALKAISYIKDLNIQCGDIQNGYINNMKLLEKGLANLLYHRVQIEERNFNKLAEDIKNSYYMVEILPQLKLETTDCLNQCARSHLFGRVIDANLRKFCEHRFHSLFNGFNTEVYQTVMPNHWKELKNQVEMRQETYKLALSIESDIAENRKNTFKIFSECLTN